MLISHDYKRDRRGKLAVCPILFSFPPTMKIKSICFCLRERKSKENEVEDLEKLSNDKTSHKGKNEGYPSTTTHAGDDNKVHGGSTIGSNGAGVVASAVVTAAHESLMSQDGSGHGHAHHEGGSCGDGEG